MDLTALEKILRSFSYVNKSWKDNLARGNVIIIECASTVKESRFNRTIDCSNQSFEELEDLLKSIVSYFDENENSNESFRVWIFDELMCEYENY